MYLKLCEQCELKRGHVKKGLVVKPILSEDRNSRCQIDLIDLQSCPTEEGYKHILVYQVFKFIKLFFKPKTGPFDKICRVEGSAEEVCLGSRWPSERNICYIGCTTHPPER